MIVVSLPPSNGVAVERRSNGLGNPLVQKLHPSLREVTLLVSTKFNPFPSNAFIYSETSVKGVRVALMEEKRTTSQQRTKWLIPQGCPLFRGSTVHCRSQ